LTTHDAAQVEAKRIIVIEDDHETRDVLADLFVLLGHEVVAVATGGAGVAACLDRQVDVVFIDLDLPDMNGYDVARQIRSSTWVSPPHLVALTGRSQPADIEGSFQAGMALHVVKPVGLYVLRTIVGDVVGGHRPSQWPPGSRK
jgi:CheY-like chemotaxis protein